MELCLFDSPAARKECTGIALHEVDTLGAFFDILWQDPVPTRAKLIAEPWDPRLSGILKICPVALFSSLVHPSSRSQNQMYE